MRQQHVVHDRLYPLDIYDDFEYLCFNFPQAEIQRITDLLAADLQRDTDRNSTLSPSLQVYLAYFATGSFQNLVGDSFKYINLLYVEQ